jgi:diketogulonate reductase-like aldo/keto reductase
LGKVGTLVDKTEAQAGLNWFLRHESVIVIPKAASVDYGIENCGASGWQLSPQQIKLLDSIIGFRCRRGPELFLRKMARCALQRFGHNL